MKAATIPLESGPSTLSTAWFGLNGHVGANGLAVERREKQTIMRIGRREGIEIMVGIRIGL